MAKIGTLYTTVTGDTKPLNKKLVEARKTGERAGKKISGAIGKINFKRAVIGAAAVTAGIYAINRVLQKFIGLASEQERVEKRLGAVLKSTGRAAGYNLDQMKAMASEMQRVTTTGDEVILSGMAILATFKLIRREAFERATMAALDLSEVMQQDLRSSIVMVGKALNDPIANLGALGRAGVQFTKDQKEVIKSLWETGNAAKAQNIILTEMESQFGGVAKAARFTYAGAMDSAKAVISDLGEELGFVVTKNDALIYSINEAEDEIRDIIPLVKQWREENEALASNGFGNLIDTIKNTIGILGLLGSAWNKVGTQGQRALIAMTSGVQMLKYQIDNINLLTAALRGYGKSSEFWVKSTRKSVMEYGHEMQRLRGFHEQTEEDLDNLKSAFDVTYQGIVGGWDTTISKLTATDKILTAFFKDIEKAGEKVEIIIADQIEEELNRSTVAVQDWTKIHDEAMDIYVRQWRDAENQIMEDYKDWKEQFDAEQLAALPVKIDIELDKFFGDIDALESRMDQNNQKMKELTQDTAAAMEGAFSDIFFDTMHGEFKSLEDYASSIFDSIARSIADLISKQLIESLMSSLGGGGGGGGGGGEGGNDWAQLGLAIASSFHGGGIVGKTKVPTRMVNSGLFSNAPRLAGGLKPDEFPAILHKGETVIPKSGSNKVSAQKGNVFNINITSPSGNIDPGSMSQLHFQLGNAIQDSIRKNR